MLFSPRQNRAHMPVFARDAGQLQLAMYRDLD